MRRRVALGLFCATFLALLSYWVFRPEPNRKEMDRIVETGHPSNAWSEYRLICFNSNTGTEREDFARAATRAGVNIERSLSACGVRRSCCELRSESTAIGLIRGDEIQCVDINRAYLLDGVREACIRPADLRITRETFSSNYHSSGRPWVGAAGSTYYKIAEQRP